MTRRVLVALLWLLAAGVLWWALRAAPLAEIATVLRALTAWQVLILLTVNAGIVLLFGMRWWLILRAQGYTIPYGAIARYRLAAFGVSYFTPGQHFGGEPLQVYLVNKRHAVPGTTAIAAITLDRVLELIANFTFLVIGVAVVLSSGVFAGIAPCSTLLPVAGLLVLPGAYLAALWLNRSPFTAILLVLTSRLPKAGWLEKLADAVRSAEREMADFCRHKPAVMAQAVVVSALVWVTLIFEYWLALLFLGHALAVWEIIIFMTAARLALLTPLPGAVGALEAGQVLAAQSLSLEPALGLGLGLLIRARDISFGLAGLWLAGLRRN